MKGKSIAVIQKQIIMKIIIWWRETTKLWHISAKTLVKWFWWVLARVRSAELRWISKPAQEFFNYIKSSCMIFSAKMSGYPKLYIGYKDNQQNLGQKFLNYIKSWCAKMSWYFHIVYYWHALKPFIALLSKNWFYFFLIFWQTSDVNSSSIFFLVLIHYTMLLCIIQCLYNASAMEQWPSG